MCPALVSAVTRLGGLCEGGFDAARAGVSAEARYGDARGADAARVGFGVERGQVQGCGVHVPGIDIHQYPGPGRNRDAQVDVAAAESEGRAVPGQGEDAVHHGVTGLGLVPGPSSGGLDLHLAGDRTRDEGHVAGVLVDDELTDAIGGEVAPVALGHGVVRHGQGADDEREGSRRGGSREQSGPPAPARLAWGDGVRRQFDGGGHG